MARYAKRLGDLCLLAGSPQDAKGHYETAIATGRAVGEPLYVASSHEDLAAAVLLEVAALESGSAAAFLERYDQCALPFFQLYSDMSAMTWWAHIPLCSCECAALLNNAQALVWVRVDLGQGGLQRLPLFIFKQACDTEYTSSCVFWLNT